MTATTTYTFSEAIDRIGMCTDRWELSILCTVLDSEKHRYSPYHWQLIIEAVSIMAKVVQ